MLMSKEAEVLDESTASLFREGKGGWEETWQSSAKPKRITLQGHTFACYYLHHFVCMDHHARRKTGRGREREKKKKEDEERREEKRRASKNI